MAQSEVHSLSDSSCSLINLQLLVSQVGLLQVSAYLGCLTIVVGRAQTMKQSRKKCGGKIEKILHLGPGGSCA